MSPSSIVRGDVIEVNLDPTIGTEIKKTRRCVVVQNNIGNQHSRRTIIVPASAAEKPLSKPFPVWVPVTPNDGGFTKDAIIMCDQIRAIDKQRIVRNCGRLSASAMEKVDLALKISLGLK
ncbi:MAG: type II toxin-antitoxin system PemK/MazF family toxin [Acidobacteriaceae bacterium]|nr:type II toxin-antitoxin system PemK/MazF family toxin [Acidobacteriaceae bacterium]MBV9781249.1 type II toxin-antitoxin system PemK/MazF family toxin [Acidobacteriaceae bacterium]